MSFSVICALQAQSVHRSSACNACRSRYCFTRYVCLSVCPCRYCV